MSDTTTFPAFVDALKANMETRLSATEGLESVTFFTAPITPGIALPADTIVIDRTTTVDRDSEQMPKTFRDEYGVAGAITAMKAGKTTKAGAESEAVAVRDRCLAILNVLKAELVADSTQSGTVTRAHISDTAWSQGVSPDTKKRICVVDFTIQVRARVQ